MFGFSNSSISFNSCMGPRSMPRKTKGVWSKQFEVEPCAGRAAADNLWAPPQTFGDRSRCHCCCVGLTYFVAISMTKKGNQKMLRIERNVFRESLKEIVWPIA